MSPEFAALVVRYVEGERFNVRTQCALIGSSTTRFYKYVSRFAEHGVKGFYPDSRRPVSSPGALSSEVEDLVVLARKQLAEQGWDAGADSIRFQLTTWCDHQSSHRDAALLAPASWPLGQAVPSRASINRILERRGQLLAVPQRRPKASRRRFEADQPNTRWQMDGFVVTLADDTTVCVIHIVDDCSRLDIALAAVRSENSADVWAVFQDAVARHGLPREVLTDNGTAFSGARRGWISALTENLTALGVRHITSSVGHPQTCGKCERAHRTVRQWLAKRALHATTAELNEALTVYRHLHNNHRPRKHLNGMTPAQRYRLGPLDAPADTHASPVQITTKPVAPNGTIAIDRISVHIGRAHARASVTVIRQDQHLIVLREQKLIAEIDLERGIRYQSATKFATQVSAKS